MPSVSNSLKSQRPRALHPALTIGGHKSLVHRLSLWLVGLTILTSAFVFAEPAPVDVLTMGLIIGLPVVGLTYFHAGLLAFLAVWVVIGACHIIAVSFVSHTGDALIHVIVSIYLFVAAAVFAAFVARKPKAHALLLLNAYTGAAVIAALLGIAGYFDLVPSAQELFTKFGRASGPFKDPNVFGPFLIPALIYALHRVLDIHERPSRVWLMAGVLSVLTFAELLSFSRGAWAATGVAVLIYLSLSFLTAKYYRQQFNIVTLTLIGGTLAALALLAAAQTDAIGDLLAERAQLTQAYDEGHEGRFGGQMKAIDLLLDHPLGIGALEFAQTYHSEEVHNVYLTMMLKAGWLGGGLYFLIMLATLMFGLRHAFRRTATQPLFIIAFAALSATILEGLLIDIDHWRHVYLLLAIVWGLMLTDRTIVRRPRIIADISEQRMQLAGIAPIAANALQPSRAPRITAAAPVNASVLFDVRGYSAHAHRKPRLVRARH